MKTMLVSVSCLIFMLSGIIACPALAGGPEPQYDSGLTLFSQGRYDEAAVKFKSASEVDPNNADAFYYWGVSLKNSGRGDAAAQKFENAATADPHHARALFMWGVSLSDAGKYAEAADKYERATGQDPQLCKGFYLWGAALEKLGRFDEAASKYKAASGLNPKLADTVKSDIERLNACRTKPEKQRASKSGHKAAKKGNGLENSAGLSYTHGGDFIKIMEDTK